MNKGKTSKWRMIGLGLVVTLFMIIGYFVIAYFQMQQAFARDKLPNDVPFETTAWKDGSPRERGQMVQQLIDQVGVIDRNRQQIDSLLGPADGSWETGDSTYPFCLSYYVDEGGSLYSSNMLLFLDSNERVIELFFDD